MSTITTDVRNKWLTSSPVDGFNSSVDGLFTERMPALFDLLIQQMKHPMPVAFFDEGGRGPASILRDSRFRRHVAGIEASLADAIEHSRKIGKSPKRNDFAGVYVFLASGTPNVPFYVGITRTLISRVRGHLRGKTHHQATLLHQLVRSLGDAKPQYRGNVDLNSKGARAALAWLREQRIAVLPLASPVERYAFELYASIKLRTGRWNSFETH